VLARQALYTAVIPPALNWGFSTGHLSIYHQGIPWLKEQTAQSITSIL
jgi:hypothetical protein